MRRLVLYSDQTLLLCADGGGVVSKEERITCFGPMTELRNGKLIKKLGKGETTSL